MVNITGALQDMLDAGATVTFGGGAEVEPDSVTFTDRFWSETRESLHGDIGATFAGAYARWVEYRAGFTRSENGEIARLVG
jgi:hypothetical protein